MKMKLRLAYSLLLIGLILFVISCNRSSTSVAASQSKGFDAEMLKEAEAKMKQYTDERKYAGISTLVAKDGKIIQRANFGYLDVENKVPVEDNSIFQIYSMTKPVTAVALMILWDEGKFKLDDKVSDYVPEFRNTKVYVKDGNAIELVPQKNELTIRHLLTHTSGMTYGWDESDVDKLYKAQENNGWGKTIADQTRKIANLPLCFQPGTKYHYGYSTDVAGYLVEVLSEMPLDKFFKTRIFDPLDMEDTGFYVPEGKLHRLTKMYQRNAEGVVKERKSWWGDNLHESTVTLFSGGAGLLSTVGDYYRFCAMLLNEGVLEDTRILSARAAKLIMTNQMPPGVTYWGHGHGLSGVVDNQTREYYWSGAASTAFWIDPKKELIIITYAQLMASDNSYANEFREMIRKALKSDKSKIYAIK